MIGCDEAFFSAGGLEHSLETHVGVGGDLHSVSVGTEDSKTGHCVVSENVQNFIMNQSEIHCQQCQQLFSP